MTAAQVLVLSLLTVPVVVALCGPWARRLDAHIDKEARHG